MACDFVVVVPDGSIVVQDNQGRQRSVADVILDSLEQIDRVEADLTIYRSTSEISQVNQLAATRPVAVSEGTFRLLQRAMLLSEQTNGAFDITAGPLVEAWGFTTRQGRKPDRWEIEEALSKVGSDKISLDESTGCVSFLSPGVKINLGAIGKGEAIDRLAKELHRCGVQDFLVHAGHSSVFASGSPEPSRQDEGQKQENAPEIGWPVGVAHPTKPRTRLCGIRLQGALATSGSGKQFFHHRGQRYGHVIDPRTGMPAGDLLSLTICVPQASDADALATGLYVLGRERATELATEHGWKCLMIASGERQDDVVITTVGEWDWVNSSA